jgi:protein-tyrosine-phosphatase
MPAILLSQLNQRHIRIALNGGLMSAPNTVLFVCLHGSAKSVIAAEHLRVLAARRGLPVACASAGLEPDAELPPHVVAGLSRDGIDAAGIRPRAATPGLVTDAAHVVALGCDLTPLGAGDATRWDDIPAVSDGYDAARDAIVARLGPLLDQIATGRIGSEARSPVQD